MKTKQIVAALVAVGLGSASTAAMALGGFGLTSDQKLVRIQTPNPGNTRLVGPISGFTGADTALVGIDMRVQDGNLYGVGNGGGVYLISKTTGALTLVNSLSATLSGTNFGVDFNPAADRLRIISDDGQNLRHNLAGTTLTDGTLDFPPATVDTVGPTATGVVATAYTNNDLNGSTGTTQFVIDATNNRLAIQSPPNNGTLVPVGALGVDATDQTGLDIFTNITGGNIANNIGYMTVLNAGVATLYSVNLLTGVATSNGVMNFPVMDLALFIE